MSPREGHTTIGVSIPARDALDEIVERLRKDGRHGASRAGVVYQLALWYGDDLVQRLREPVRVGGGRED